MEPITLLALAGAAYMLLKKKKAPSTKHPVGPRPTLLRLSATVRDGNLVFEPSSDSRIAIDDNEALLRERLPFDVLVSVPESMSPAKIQEINGASLVAGTEGTTRDLMFRITEYGQAALEGANIRLSVMRGTTGGTLAMGLLWITALKTTAAETHANVYLGDDDLWFFGGYKDGELVLVDGPFANQAAAKSAATNWESAQ